MATVDQDTRRLQRELRDLWRIRNYYAAQIEDRRNDNAFLGDPPARNQLRQYYTTLGLYLALFEEQYRETYRRLRKWSRAYAAIPDVFETPLGPQQTEIVRPMCTTNRLTNAQLDAQITLEEFKSDGNRYENLWDVVDAQLDWLVVFSLRMKGWSNQWDARGNQPRFNRVVAILEDQIAVARAGQTLLEDLAETVNSQKGAGVDELELRQNYSRRRNAIGGGLYALNRGLTTAELGGTTEPVEFDPDVASVRDFPDLGTDVP